MSLVEPTRARVADLQGEPLRLDPLLELLVEAFAVLTLRHRDSGLTER